MPGTRNKLFEMIFMKRVTGSSFIEMLKVERSPKYQESGHENIKDPDMKKGKAGRKARHEERRFLSGMYSLIGS